MKRKGFTLVELLVIVAILVIVAALFAGVVGGCSMISGGYYDVQKSGTYICNKTYTYTPQKSEGSAETQKRIDVQEVDPATGTPIGIVQTFSVNDDYMAGINNSATLFAQFQVRQVYKIDTIGTRREGFYSYFPLVKSVTKINKSNLSWELPND